MPALGSHSLNAACRAIYVQAAEDHILPRIVRDAADEQPPHRHLEASIPEGIVRLRVVYEEPGRGASGQVERAPLRFEVEGRSFDDEEIFLEEADRRELIRAFLLGVREPVAVESPSNDGDWRVALRVAPRFVMWAPQPQELDPRLSAAEISQRLAALLAERTGDLLPDRAVLTDVWTTRLREELFGEPKLNADDLWPLAAADCADQETALPALAWSPALAAPPARQSRPRRRAMAAALAMLGMAAFAGALAARSQRAPAQPQQAVLVAAAPAERAAAPETSPPLPARAAEPILDRAPWSPSTPDLRFTRLAPAVTTASQSLATPAVFDPDEALPVLPVRETMPPLPPRRPASFSARQPPAWHAQAHRPPSTLARVDRAVKKFVKSIGAHMPRIKMSALNSPHAAGPRAP